MAGIFIVPAEKAQDVRWEEVPSFPSLYIYISSLGSYVLTGYVSSKVRCEYRSNVGAVG